MKYYKTEHFVAHRVSDGRGSLFYDVQSVIPHGIAVALFCSGSLAKQTQGSIFLCGAHWKMEMETVAFVMSVENSLALSI